MQRYTFFAISWQRLVGSGQHNNSFNKKSYLCLMQKQEPSSTSGVPSPLDFNISRQFTHHERLHSGESSCVWRAERYGKWYILKAIAPEHANDSVYMSVLEKEFAQAVTLDHPNIAHVYGLEHDEVVGSCMVMEYVEGRSLTQFLDEKPSFRKRHKVAMQLIDAMEYFHARQVVHRDLKPSNIVITDRNDNVKVLDFGLADRDDYAVLKGPAYSQGYASPEQIAGKEIDCRTDIYSFGVLLRQLFPHRYGRIARRCLRRLPLDRYSSAAEVRTAINKNDRLLWLLPTIAALLLVLAGLAIGIVKHAQPKVDPTYTCDFTDVTPSDHTLYYCIYDLNKVRTVKGCEGSECVTGKLVIPERAVFQGLSYTVTEISGAFYGTFQGYLKLTEVEIPSTVTSIGMNAFCCTGLTTVTIPNRVKTIGAYAFNVCKDLRTVTIGESVETIGRKAFWRCTAIDTIRCLGTTPPAIMEDTFLDANTTATVVVPAGTEALYRQAWGDTFNYVSDSSSVMP